MSTATRLISAADATKATGQRPRRWKRYSSLTFYLFVAPWVLGFLFLTVAPLIFAVGVSFTNFDGISAWHWIGFKNYATLLGDSDTWFSLRQTFLYALITVPLGIAGGLGLAVLLNRPMRSIGLFRTIYYLPAVVPIVASAIIWKLVFDRDTGVLNAILGFFHLNGITWLIDPYVFFALVIMVLWGMGGGMIISLAGLQGIPTELREAAAVDGARPVHIFFRITLPLLSPVLFFQVVTGFIGSLQTLIQPLLLAQTGGEAQAGTIPRSNYLYMVHVYEQFFFYQKFGYGSALLWVLFIFILVVTLLFFRSSSYWVYSEKQ